MAFTGSYLPAFLDEMKSINNPVALEMAEAYLALGLINEALAVFLEEVFLKELGV